MNQFERNFIKSPNYLVAYREGKTEFFNFDLAMENDFCNVWTGLFRSRDIDYPATHFRVQNGDVVKSI